MHNISENFNALAAVTPDSYNSVQTSGAFDMKKTDQACLVVNVGTIGTSLVVAAQDCATSGGIYANLTDTITTISATGVYLIDVKDYRRYLKVVATPTGASKFDVELLVAKRRISYEEPAAV